MSCRHSKKQNQRFHARNRAQERYGIVYNKFLRKEILGLIANNKATLVSKPSLRVRIYELTLANQRVRLVYDKTRKEVVTFLPPKDTSGQIVKDEYEYDFLEEK